MITAEMANVEIEIGLSAVCAWCEHWHNAKERGDIASCGMRCGGPVSGMGFPRYKGPVEMVLASFCFICGKSASAAVEIFGNTIGVCDRMGPGNETCKDKMIAMLNRRGNISVKEHLVPIIGGE
jgi:hypothetical protein